MDLFWTPNQFLDISFFYFDPLPPWNRWGCCCLMGPACHPLRTVNVFFSWILLTKRFLAYFFFRSPAVFKTLRTPLAHGSHMSTSINNKSFLSWSYFLPLISGYFLFLLIPCRLWNVEESAGSSVPHVSLPIIAQPRKGRKIREHNTDMTETRAARVEQNTRHKVEPSTLYQVYRCIKIT